MPEAPQCGDRSAGELGQSQEAALLPSCCRRGETMLYAPLQPSVFGRQGAGGARRGLGPSPCSEQHH